MLNTQRHRDELFTYLNGLELISKLAPILGPGGGYKLRFEDGMIVPDNHKMSHTSPWVYVKHDLDMRCNIFNAVFFRCLGLIPSRCRACWKVVVRPRTLIELFDLYEIQKGMGVACKCGIELRETTRSLYGGYFYCKGRAEGEFRYRQVRKAVDSYLSPETPVILKRYCTEYEVGPGSKGPSDKLPEMTEAEKRYEEYVLSHFPQVYMNGQQPDHVIASVMIGWIKHAYRNSDATGDDSYKILTGGKPLHAPYVTYHENCA